MDETVLANASIRATQTYIFADKYNMEAFAKGFTEAIR